MRPIVAFVLAQSVLAPALGPQTVRAEPPALALVLQGKVEDRATHRPIGGATVRVRRIIVGAKGLADRALPAEASLKTDERGRIKVVFPSEQVGDPRLFVSFLVGHPGYLEQSTSPIPLAGLDLERRQGARPTLGVITLERGLEYKGRVFTPEGKPAADVPFEFSTTNDVEVAEEIAFQPSKVRGRTDPDGWIRLRGPQTDTVQLWITPASWAPWRGIWGSDPRDPNYKTWNRQDLGQHRLESGLTLSGRLRRKDGRPLARQKLVAVGGELQVRRTTETDDDGRFAFAPLPRGIYQLGAENQLAGAWDPRQLQPRPEDAIVRPVVLDLKPGRAHGPVELIEAETVSLVIRHVDSLGRPVPGRTVLLAGEFAGVQGDAGETELPADVFQPLTDGPRRVPEELPLTLTWGVQGTAGADGMLVLKVPKGLDAGFEAVEPLGIFSARTRLGKDEHLESSSGRQIGVLEEDGKEITVVWYRAPTVMATIRMDEGKVPENARVVIFIKTNGFRSEEEVEPLSDGRFGSRGLLPDFEYWARAEAEGFEGPEVKFSLPEGAIEEMTLELKRAQESKKEDDPQERAP